MTKRGLYIVLEGVDGVGKTTQANSLVNNLQRHFTKAGLQPEIVKTHEPGGTPAGQLIRQAILHQACPGQYTAEEEFGFMHASRSYLLDEVLKPSLDSGNIVISDRNWLSSIAYQGHNLSPKYIMDRSIELMGDYAFPNLLVYLDASLEVISSRNSHKSPDYFESKPSDFFEGVLGRYRQNKYLFNFVQIDSQQTPTDISKQIFNAVLDII